MAQQQRSRRHPHIHSRMREQHGKRIPPRVTISAQFHECSNGFLRVSVSDFRIASHDLLGLSLYVIGELLNQPL